MSCEKIILALDVKKEEALELCQKLSGEIGVVKVGLELFCAGGKEILTEISKAGMEIFLDLKFHDIPQQVERAVRVVSSWPVKMLTLHCLGGRKMLEAAVEAASSRFPRPLLLGVTLLTSLDSEELSYLPLDSVEESVLSLTELALECGLDGVVASPREVKFLRKRLGEDFIIVTPGIRLKRQDGDQRRTASPREAVLAGADYIVVGREVTRDENPVLALRRIIEEVTFS